MNEVAFRVVCNSELYKQYFSAREEKEKFHKLAREFFQKYNLCDSGTYYQSEFLALELTPEKREQFAKQIKKNCDKNGMWLFKKNSAMQKEWSRDVVAHIDFKKLNCNRFWYMNLIHYRGRYALWSRENEVYGFLESDYDDFSVLPDYLERISMSEYYRIRDGV